MTWRPISEEELWEEINRGWKAMSLPQRRLWEAIKVPPQKWQLHPWGDLGGGFWIVAIMGERVIWYNDIEEGFNRSHYTELGTVSQYWCNQDELQWTVGYLLGVMETGSDGGGFAGPPQPVV
jgi:hypothetical protein